MTSFDPRRLKAVLWDMDGTLADTIPDILDVFNRLLADHGRPTLDAKELVSHFGPPEEVILEKLLPELDRPEIERKLAAYAEGGKRLACFEGIFPILEQLHARGIRHGVFTGAGRIFGGARMRRLGIDGMVEGFVCADDVTNTKPAPDGLLELCRRLSVTPSRSIYVGDSPLDARSAASAGIPFVAVGWGVHELADFESESPVAVVHDRAELADLLLGSGHA